MFSFNSNTQVNKKFRLAELYKLMGAGKEVKADAANILSVTLKNVLNNVTMNFSKVCAVKEIYVFEIILTEQTVPTLFISSLDKVTNFHTLFVLRCGNKHMLYGAFKEYGESGMKAGKYYSTQWSEEGDKPLPFNLTDLDGVYTMLIDELIPITARQAESTKDFVLRYDEILKLRKEIDKLKKLIANEKQPKRRFELNAELKQRIKELGELE
ncbi:MAG: DUF4391 domain-containing protein [Candidatus Coproplasma sp.]